VDQERMADRVDEMTETVKTKVKEGIEQGRARLPDLETTAESVRNLAAQARSGAVKAGAAVQDAARQAGTQVNDAASSLYQRGARAGDYLSERTIEQPLAALLVAGAIGYLLAVLIHRRG
jgi:ElaB/YqjD/DUF883 family membrane-anchored ribosome-binding protein